MIPFIRSLNELMVITQPRLEIIKNKDRNKSRNYSEVDSLENRSTTSINDKEIHLPDLPKFRRPKWIKNKEKMLKLLDQLDYNDQIQSSYELTLIETQKNHEENDVA
tara:strand:+ start:845 stop:1165 length:321 start_codon:yes stop_codon:yes gene_type:complete